MSDLITIPNWISIPVAAGGPFYSPPLQLKSQGRMLTATSVTASGGNSLNGTNLGYNQTVIQIPPSVGLGEVVGGHVGLFVTSNAGTNPTATLSFEGTDNLNDLTQQASAAISAVATTLTVGSATGLAVGDYVMLYETDGSLYEWVLITNISSNTLTVTRGVWGTIANAYTTLPYVFKSTSWTPIPTGSASTPTATSGAVALTGGTAASPQVIMLDMQQLGMDMIDFAFVHAKVTVGGTATPTLTGYVNAGFRYNPETNVISNFG